MWTNGIITISGETLRYWVKHYDSPSQYGIDNGRVSKLEIRDECNEICANYDRCWDVYPDGDETAQAALAELLERFN